jgi:hypothetical protein
MSKRSIIILIAIISLISGYKLLSKSEYSRNAITIEKNSHYYDQKTTEVSVTETEDIKEEDTEARKAAESQPRVKVKTADHKPVAKDKKIDIKKSEVSDNSTNQSENESFKTESVSYSTNNQNNETSTKTEIKSEDSVERTTQATQPKQDVTEKPITEATTEEITEARTETSTEPKIQNNPETKTQNEPEVKEQTTEVLVQNTTEEPTQNTTEVITQTVVENVTPAACDHNWVWKTHTEIIHHDAEYTEYLLCEEYDENVYESHTFCNNCNLDMTINFGGASSSEAANHMHNICGGCGYHSGQAVVGTIHHDAEYGSYCSVAPYDEYVEVNDYQYCSICGERR